jgi:hypothetical protein
MKTVEQLRRSGYKVKVCHRRLYEAPDCDYILSRFEVNDLRNKGLELKGPIEVGGETVITITTPDAKTVESTAECSIKDHFHRKKGLTIALGRALAQLS